MGKALFVAEKPSLARDVSVVVKAKEIEKGVFENDEWVIVSCAGHLIETILPPFANQPLPLFFEEEFAPISNSFSLSKLALIEKHMKRDDITLLINGADAGREGEAIFWRVYNYLQCKKPVKRFWCTNQSEDGIRHAMKNLQDGQKYIPLFMSASCRNLGDMLLGVNSSRSTNLAVGRVKTPTLKFVVDAYLANTQFEPKDYWELAGVFNGGKGNFEAKLYDEEGKIKKFNTIQDLSLFVTNNLPKNTPCQIKDVSSLTETAPPALFDTTELAMAAFKKFGYSVSEVGEVILQELYDKYKASTYPRTDSTVLPSSFATPKDAPIESTEQTATSNIRMEQVFFNFQDNAVYGDFAIGIVQSGAATNAQNKKIYVSEMTEDHYALIPTGTIRISGQDVPIDNISHDDLKQILPEKHFNVFDLLVRRTLAAFMPNAVYAKTQRTITLENGLTFKTSGRVLKKAGWLAVYGEQDEKKDENEKDGVLPPIDDSGNGILVEHKDIKQKTKAPPLLDQSTLLDLMKHASKKVENNELGKTIKECGIGTGATRTGIIGELMSNENNRKPYITENSKKQLIPTELGLKTIHFLSQVVPQVTLPDLTAEWETMLDLVARERMTRAEFIAKIHEDITILVAQVKQNAHLLPQTNRVDIGECPNCHNGRVIKATKRYFCSERCGFDMPLTLLGVDIKEQIAKEIIEKGTTAKFYQFTKDDGKKFQAALTLTEKPHYETNEMIKAIGFKFEEYKQVENCPCPKCKQNSIAKTSQRVKCVTEGCDFSMFTNILGVKLADADLKLLFSGKITRMFSGFTTKEKKVFSAKLRLKQDCSGVDFIFDNQFKSKGKGKS